MKSGEYTVKIAKDMYAPYTDRVTVSDNKITTLSPILTADFARVTLTVDSEAEIWVNDEKKGTRTWTGNLALGTYRIECRMYGHEFTTTAKEITNTMDGETIILPAPKPIYGSLNIESDPDFAKIFVDGNPMGETPNFISQLLIGQHEIKLTKDGFADYTETITIAKGERKQVQATLTVTENTRNHDIAMQPVRKDEETFTINGVSFTMKLVEGGTFQMGATSEQGSDAFDDEKPVHSVSLNDYYIGETEVTQALWKAVMGSNPSPRKGDNLPIEQMWYDCQKFISKLNQKTGKNFRLPTEAEWEYAARGGRKSKGYKYAGSNNIDNIAWYKDNSETKPHPVKGKAANELGLYDMSGNALEWCQDWYENYNSDSHSNSTRTTTSGLHVLRGGYWFSDPRQCRVTQRIKNLGDGFYGFRLALPQ